MVEVVDLLLFSLCEKVTGNTYTLHVPHTLKWLTLQNDVGAHDQSLVKPFSLHKNSMTVIAIVLCLRSLAHILGELSISTLI